MYNVYTPLAPCIFNGSIHTSIYNEFTPQSLSTFNGSIHNSMYNIYEYNTTARGAATGGDGGDMSPTSKSRGTS